METEIVSDVSSMEVADFTDSEMESCAESNSDIDFVPSEDLLQNRKSLRALAEASDRYHINGGAGAAIAAAVLVEFDMIAPDKTQSVIDKIYLRKERAKLRNETKKNKKRFFEKVDGIGFNGRQDATLAVDKVNKKHFTSAILEEHYVITEGPIDFYLYHFTPKSGRCLDIAYGLW